MLKENKKMVLEDENNQSVQGVEQREMAETVNDSKPQNQLETGESGKKEKKKISVGLILILVLVFLAGVLGVFAYKYFSENPTSIVKLVINRAYEDFSKSLDDIDKSTGEIDLFNEVVRSSGDLKFNDKNYAGLDKEKIEYDMALDYKNKKAEVMVGIIKDGSRLADGKIYYQNDKMFLESSTMFDNLYDLGEANFDDMFDFSELDTDATIDVDDIDYVVKSFKDAFLDALDDKEMNLSKGELNIDGKTIKANEITYNISRESYENLKEKLAENVLDNSKLVKKLAELSGQTEKQIEDSFKEMKNSKVDGDIGGEFIIYTTGIDHKLVKVELRDEDGTCYYTSYEDKTKFVYDVAQSKIEVTSIKKDETYEVTVEVMDEEVVEMTIRSFEEDEIDLDYSVSYDVMNFDGTLKITANSKSKKEVSGTIDFSLSGEDWSGNNYDYDFEFTYTLKTDSPLEDVGSAKSINDFSDADSEKMLNKFSELGESALFNYFGSGFLSGGY